MSASTTLEPSVARSFESINAGYDAVFRPGRLSLGLVVPIERYASGPVPTMSDHVARVKLAEALGFSAVWLRDVPFTVPSFGDAGQTFDPFVYLGYLAAHTQRIALGVASIVLPLRHPAHVAKAAASVDQLAGGRLIMGVASGDRPDEYPAMNLSFSDRSDRFRESFDYIRRMAERAPTFDNGYGSVGGGIDMLPKPVSGRLPLLITGGSQQGPEWIATNGDGWMVYPRETAVQQKVIADWRRRTQASGMQPKPVMQPLYVDLLEDSNARPQPIHLGLRLGARHLRTYLRRLEAIGVNHVALNLRFNQASIEATLERLANELGPNFVS
ncbi:MAG: LLM class oxidoreductase [Myxococcota bacterium]